MQKSILAHIIKPIEKEKLKNIKLDNVISLVDSKINFIRREPRINIDRIVYDFTYLNEIKN